MKVLIIGCGRVGSMVARELSDQGNDVTIVDWKASSFAKFAARGVLDEGFKGTVMVGDGTDVDMLRRAGIEQADVFIAVTEGDNRNIMAAQIAQHVFKVPRVVCRIYDPIREQAYRKLGLHTLCPTTQGATTIREMVMEA